MDTPSHSPTPYPEVNRGLQALLEQVRLILGEQFLGFYLYGSLAQGDFNLQRSDIDFVVLTHEALSSEKIEELRTMHARLEKGDLPWVQKLEGAYLPRAVIRGHDPAHPPVPTLNEGRFYLAPLGADWVIQRHVLRQDKAVITGPPLSDLIDPVSEKALVGAVRGVLKTWWAAMIENPQRLTAPGYQPFAVLSMCRALYTVRTGKLGSKTESAEWALRELGEEWHSLIRKALNWKRGDPEGSIPRTVEMISFVLESADILGSRNKKR
jgi:hypothetical protein